MFWQLKTPERTILQNVLQGLEDAEKFDAHINIHWITQIQSHTALCFSAEYKKKDIYHLSTYVYIVYLSIYPL